MATDNVWVRADEHGSGLLLGWTLHRSSSIRSVELIRGVLSVRLDGETRYLQVGKVSAADPAGQLLQLIAEAAQQPGVRVVEDRGGELWTGPVQDAIAHRAEHHANQAIDRTVANLEARLRDD